MDHSTIINRLEVVIDSIEYEEMNLTDAYDVLVLIVSDIESSLDYDADFGNVQFEDLD